MPKCNAVIVNRSFNIASFVFVFDRDWHCTHDQWHILDSPGHDAVFRRKLAEIGKCEKHYIVSVLFFIVECHVLMNDSFSAFFLAGDDACGRSLSHSPVLRTAKATALHSSPDAGCAPCLLCPQCVTASFVIIGRGRCANLPPLCSYDWHSFSSSGIVLVLIKWSKLGILCELFGFFNLFG